MKPGDCKHFTGLQNKTCSKGVSYADLRDASEPGPAQWPCLKIPGYREAKTICAHFEPLTPLELKAFSEKGHVRGAAACQMVPSRLRSARDEFADVWERSYPGSWARNDWAWVIRYKPVILAGRSVQ